MVKLGSVDAQRLRDYMSEATVRVTINDDRLRIGVHYFNTSGDIRRLIKVMSEVAS